MELGLAGGPDRGCHWRCRQAPRRALDFHSVDTSVRMKLGLAGGPELRLPTRGGKALRTSTFAALGLARSGRLIIGLGLSVTRPPRVRHHTILRRIWKYGRKRNAVQTKAGVFRIL